MCEFSDPDYLVLMLTPAIEQEALTRLCDALCEIQRLAPITNAPPPLIRGEQILSVREALLTPATPCRISDAEGCVLADASFSCPPAIPILVCGERITREAIDTLTYYHIEHCNVLDA